MQDNTKKTLFRIAIILLLLLSILSGVIVFFATTNGPWGYSDSVAYIVSARNLIKGLGFGMFTPTGRFVITYLHPPLYPIVLSGIGVWGVDLVDAARWCNIVLCIITVFMTGFVFLRFSHNPTTAILASMLIVSFPTILSMFTSSMSEPLFLCLFSVNNFLLLNYLRKQTMVDFFLAAFFCGLLPVTRYAGVAIVFSAIICVFLFSTGSWRERSKRSFIFGFSASIPLIIWFTVLYFGPSNALLGGRNIQINGEQLVASFSSYREAVMEILWNWIPFSQRSVFLVLDPARDIMLIVAFFIISAVTWVAGLRLAKRNRDCKYNPDVQMSVFFGVVTVSYIVFFTITWLFTIPPTPINDRLLMPIYFGGLLGLLGCWAVWREAWWSSANSLIRVAPWLVAIVMIYWYYPQAVRVVIQSYENNTIIAYRWQDSQVIHALQNLPAGQPVISNNSAAVMMWADRPAYDLMDNLNPDFMKQNFPYGSDDTDAAQRIFREGAVLVVFNDFPYQLDVAYGRHGRERLATIFDGLTIVGQYSDGMIYISSDK